MPAYSKEKQDYHKERIREVLALYPRAGGYFIRETLLKAHDDPIALDTHYVLKLKRKIEGERTHRFDHPKVEKRLAEIEDRTENIITQMWKILLDVTKDERARVAAGKIIVDAEHKFFEAQMSAGIFERKLGTVDVRHTHELSPEQKAMILKVFANYGIIQPTNTIPELPDAGASTPTLVEQGTASRNSQNV